jgi:hypothetical protein
LNLLRVPLDVLPISENSPADPFASRQPTKNFVRLSGKSSKKILQGSNRFDRVLGNLGTRFLAWRQAYLWLFLQVLFLWLLGQI